MGSGRSPSIWRALALSTSDLDEQRCHRHNSPRRGRLTGSRPGGAIPHDLKIVLCEADSGIVMRDPFPHTGALYPPHEAPHRLELAPQSDPDVGSMQWVRWGVPSME